MRTEDHTMILTTSETINKPTLMLTGRNRLKLKREPTTYIHDLLKDYMKYKN